MYPTAPRTTATHELAERLCSGGRDWWWAEGGEDDVDEGSKNEHINECVWGPHQADTGDGRRWRSRRDSDNNNNGDIKEGGSHPTPLTTTMHELEARLRSAGIPYALEDSLSDVDGVNGQRLQQAMDHPMMMKRGIMSASYELMLPFFFRN